jgi:hypothetical protein
MPSVFGVGTKDKGGLRGLEVGYTRINQVPLDEGVQQG